MKLNTVSRETVWGEANSIAPDNPIIPAVLLTSLIVGPNVRRIARYLKVDEKKVRPLRDNLVANGIWKGSRVYHSWDDEDGDIEFHCDCLVAEGYLEIIYDKGDIQKTTEGGNNQ